MSLTKRVLIALGAGLLIGIGVSAAADPRLMSAVSFVQPIGTIWVNAIRMTVVPLVFSLLVVGVASASDAASVGRIGALTLGLFIAFLVCSAIVAVILAPPIFANLRIDPATAASLRASATTSANAAAESAKHLPSFEQWLTDLMPINPIKTAADGNMLPLVIFSVLFSVAATRTPTEARDTIVRFFKSVSEVMLVLVRWIIELSPIPIFVLTLALASKLGATAAGAVGFYVLGICAIFMVELLLLYPIATVAGRMPLKRFAKAVLPAQVVAFSSRSSLASLPALLDSATRGLRLPPEVSGFVLPLGVATFKLSTPPTQVVSVLFIARLYGIELAPQQILMVAAIAIALSFSAPGIPSGGLLILAPVFASLGLPVEGIGILIAIDVIPDAARSIINVSADITVATLLTRGERIESTVPATPY
ncbi:MAG: dicarboxylate/amino acid:cation symporter [Gemmatimonadaceae bacterium]